jgi:hypothetical protein
MNAETPRRKRDAKTEFSAIAFLFLLGASAFRN